MKSWQCLLVLFACYGNRVAANSPHSRVFGVICIQNRKRKLFGSSRAEPVKSLSSSRPVMCLCCKIVISHGTALLVSIFCA